jgi:hypothetical protein
VQPPSFGVRQLRRRLLPADTALAAALARKGAEGRSILIQMILAAAIAVIDKAGSSSSSALARAREFLLDALASDLSGIGRVLLDPRLEAAALSNEAASSHLMMT